MGVPITLVVPCYDEAARLDPEPFLAALDADPDLRFHFVDDGSTDATLEVLESLAAHAPPGRVGVQRQSPNQGKAEAVRNGVLTVLDTGATGLIGFWDADLSSPLEAVSLLVSALEADPRRTMAFASRVQLLGRQIARNPLRHYGGRVVATLVSLTLGVPVYDTQCGAKLFRIDTDTRPLFSEPFRTRWLFDVEIIARWLARHPGQAWREAIVEVPLPRWTDVGGSKVSAVDVLRTPGQILDIHRYYNARQHTRGPS